MLKTKKTKAQLLAELLLANDYINELQLQLEENQNQAKYITNDLYNSLLDKELEIEQYNSVLFAVGNGLIAIEAKGNYQPFKDILKMISMYCYTLSNDLYEEDYHDVRLKQLKLIIDGITREV